MYIHTWYIHIIYMYEYNADFSSTESTQKHSQSKFVVNDFTQDAGPGGSRQLLASHFTFDPAQGARIQLGIKVEKFQHVKRRCAKQPCQNSQIFFSCFGGNKQTAMLLVFCFCFLVVVNFLFVASKVSHFHGAPHFIRKVTPLGRCVWVLPCWLRGERLCWGPCRTSKIWSSDQLGPLVKVA